MSALGPATVRDILVYPVKGEPGTALDEGEVGAGGLAGDRRKKSPVHLVSAADRDANDTRANLVLDVDADELAALVGSTVQVGSAVLILTMVPSGCPGVYADVASPGRIRRGDQLVPTAPRQTAATGEASHR